MHQIHDLESYCICLAYIIPYKAYSVLVLKLITHRNTQLKNKTRRNRFFHRAQTITNYRQHVIITTYSKSAGSVPVSR